MHMNKRNSSEIAIIGMAGRFPGADNINEFWENLKNAKENIMFFSKKELIEAGIDQDLIEDPCYVRAQGVVKNIKGFDAKFFAYTPREAENMDPQHRMFLECAWEVLENAGYGSKISPKNIGIYAGTGENNYLFKHIIPSLEGYDAINNYQLMINNSKDFLCTRVAYKLNLTGPALTIQTACSTSLVAIHQACIALQAEECEMALAGGVSLGVLEKSGYLYQPGMILSPDGKCRAFDVKAEGTVVGQGAGIVALKLLEKAIEDGDNIYAVIKGSAINNDGNEKIGFTAPSVGQQAEVIRLAHKKAGITADTVTYVEAHGTGTVLGDPIEIAGLTEAFNTKKQHFCAIGSVKTNIGHLDAAAGVAGLIKVVLSLYHKTLVPTLHYKQANPNINFAKSPFFVNTELKHWESGSFPRRAGVTSLGVGGTNAHILLEEAPIFNSIPKTRNYQLLCLSANTKFSLNKTTENFISYLHKNIKNNLEDIAYTLHIGREKFKYSKFITCRNNQEALSKLEQDGLREFEQSLDRTIIFAFPGQGSQYINMGQNLYKTEPIFKLYIDKCLSIVKEILPYPITEQDILGLTEKINQTSVTQPALFIIEYSLAQYLIELGVKPDAMIGHSIGEYVAACIGGVFSLESALRLVITRGQLLQSLPNGKMLAVSLAQNQIKEYIETYKIDIAAINSHDSCIISGSDEVINTLSDIFSAKKIAHKYLHTSHAFHSQMLDPILDSYRLEVSKVKLKPNNIPFISNLTGDWVEDKQVVNPDYWVKHLRSTVLFAKGLNCIFENNDLYNSLILEIGPSQVLTSIIKQCQSKQEKTIILPLMGRHSETQDDDLYLLNVIGRLWSEGVTINWQKFYQNKRQRLPLPNYPFERQNYWIPIKQSFLSDHKYETKFVNTIEEKELLKLKKDKEFTTNINKPDNLLQAKIIEIWQKILGIKDIDIHSDFFDLGGNSLQAIQISGKISDVLKIDIKLKDVLENSTISQLSTFILNTFSLLEPEYLVTKSKPSFIIKLRDGNGEKALFLIHPISGYIFCYRDLADCLIGDQPVYGIQSPCIDDEISVKSLSSIEAIASYYIQSIHTIQQEGPFFLLGSSFGGLVAYEMAQQLEISGHKVSLLGMADTARPDHTLLKISNEDELLLCMIESFTSQSFSLTQKSSFSEQQKLKLLLEAMELSALPPPQQQQFYKRIKTYCLAMFNYKIKPYNGKIVFFDPTDRPSQYSSWKTSDTWIGFINEGITKHEVLGNHFTMIRKPNVELLAHLLDAYIKN